MHPGGGVDIYEPLTVPARGSCIRSPKDREGPCVTVSQCWTPHPWCRKQPRKAGLAALRAETDLPRTPDPGGWLGACWPWAALPEPLGRPVVWSSWRGTQQQLPWREAGRGPAVPASTCPEALHPTFLCPRPGSSPAGSRLRSGCSRGLSSVAGKKGPGLRLCCLGGQYC